MQHHRWDPDPGPARFRHHFALDPDVRCINHGMLGACPVPVLQRQSEWRERMERQPAAFVLRELPALLDEARHALGATIGADAEDLALLPNVTTALNAVLRSLRFVPGDEILTTDHAYLACANLLDFVAERTGAVIVAAPVPTPLTGPESVLDAVLARVTARTRLAVLDHVTSPTAIVFPIAALVQRLAALGVDTLVDGAHAPGMLPLDVTVIGAAYYAGDCHKWLCSPRGAGFLHVRRDRQQGLHPAVISRGYGDTTTPRPRLHLEFDWLGTADPSALLCIPAAIAFLAGLLPGALPALHARNHALATAAAARLGADLPWTRVAPDAMVGSMVAFALPPSAATTSPLGASALQEHLYARHGIDVAVCAWPAPAGRVVRLSAQIYNTPDDYAALGPALAQCLSPSAQRGMPQSSALAGAAP
ncbi:aminotransferase class V-fold PLP-dependent enzyme [Xanthomonas campestris pv. phormiicola]|nr:aminotransferase class V-fold PLP-dependent enzyme [Xanthomonas campestris pv. phormiicola]UYC14330.1 aminotransferase class V-fold PLP-dependent enzyme [Xanthomonas campestris pv. phormiicola]